MARNSYTWEYMLVLDLDGWAVPLDLQLRQTGCLVGTDENGTYIFPTVSESKMCLEELDIQHPIPYPYSNDQIAYLRSYPNRLHPYLYMIKKYALKKYLPKILEIILGRS